MRIMTGTGGVPRRTHSTPEPDTPPPDQDPDSTPAPDEDPLPEPVPIQEPAPPPAPIKAR
ncbi:hypothetical protein [Janthinobacterium fluminis]|uniref:Uncharacterized protein n=1 Tax=Janthinobacterium fluminis TaxID=2987524 RepID=A0ABT5JU06_9BURK|nr:hypothetical protein [Janthinobacterium fluminis]MDC8756183.1 hypothetical protein [Janthinobacterium fluminis]